MKFRWIVLVAMTILSARLAGGQTGSIQPAGIDPALLAKATKGDVAAQVTVGESYASGTGVTQDYKMAAEWYRKAADKCDIAGELHLAALYRDGGKGFARDLVQAAEWYGKAAEQDHAEAQSALSRMHHKRMD